MATQDLLARTSTLLASSPNCGTRLYDPLLNLAYLIPPNEYHVDNAARLNPVNSVCLDGWIFFFWFGTPYTHFQFKLSPFK